MKPKKYIYIFIITAISIIFNLIILLFPETTINSAKRGLLLWYNSALPSLLPFIISINMLKRTMAPYYIAKLLQPVTKRLFNISGIGVFPIVMGMLSGYPLGMKLSCELYTENKIPKSQAEHLILFTNNSGPLFVIGTVGTIFLNSTKLGYLILVIHYISAIIVGVITKKKYCSCKPYYYYQNMSIAQMLSETITNSIETIVSIGGYIILFSIITGYIIPLFHSKNIQAIVYGIFEITGGCSMISSKSVIGYAIITALISWGGLSIHAQSISFIAKTDLSVIKYILAKALQALISFVLFIAVYSIINISL